MSDNDSGTRVMLLDLPLELIELVVSHLHSSTLLRLGKCSHWFKELTSSAWYWKNRIQEEKQKIIFVRADIEGKYNTAFLRYHLI